MKKNNVKKNYIYNLIYQVIILIVPIITTPYVSRVLGAERIGTYGYILSIVTYFVLFGSLGVAMYGQREIAYVQDDKEKRSKIFFEIVSLRFISMAISLIVYFFIFGTKGENVIFYRIFALEMIANLFDISWFFQGLEDFKKTVLRNAVVKILGVVAIFLFVKTKQDLYIYILIYTVSNLLGNISLWIYLPKIINKVSFKKLNLISHLKPTILMFIPQVAIQIYTVLDKTMIGTILGDMNEVGYYEQSQKIVKIGLAVIGAFGTVMAPRIANSSANNEKEKIHECLLKSFRIVWILGVAIMFGIIGISNNFVPWFFGAGYDKVKLLLIVFSPIIIAIGISNITGIQYLTQVKKQNILSISVMIGAVINIILNFIFIQLFKSIGAAIASIIAEICITIIQLIYIKRDHIIKISEMFKMSIKYLISGSIMGIFVIFIGKILPCTLIGTAVQIIIGSVVYFTILIILKDSFTIDIIKMVLKKIRLKLKLKI